jgi:hypothetical protein
MHIESIASGWVAGRSFLRGRAITESDMRSVRRTLSILHRDGFLYRAPFLDAGHERCGIGYVYGLSAKGVNHALQNGYSTLATKTLDEHSLRTLDHELEITSFHIALHRLCAAQGLRYAWRQTDLKHTVHPDAVFNVADPAHPTKAFCYFLEIERSKLGNYRNGEPQIFRKLQKFYGYFNSTGCEKEWGFRQYRVIVVQRTDARREDSSRRCARSAATACSLSRQRRRIVTTSAARSS